MITAVQRRIDACTKSSGFTYVEPEPTTPEEWISYYRLQNPLNPERAVLGHHVPPTEVREAKQEGGDEFDRALLDDGGCVDNATADVGGDTAYLNDTAALIDSLNDATITVHFASDDYEDSVLKWATCMTGRWYNYRTPDEAGAQFVGLDDASPEEFAVFAADTE